jgi:hypothetical protein
MVTDPQALATKQDIALLMEQIGKFYLATERWKNELEERLDTKLQKAVNDMKLYFDVVAENMLDDFKRGWNDRFDGHEKRISKLEHGKGLVRNWK